MEVAKVIAFATQHLWNRAAPHSIAHKNNWIISEMLRLQSSDLPESIQIYSAYQSFELVDEPYINRWNGVRADLIAAWVDPPDGDLEAIPLSLEPPKGEHPGPWLLSYVLGYSRREIKIMESDAKGTGSAMVHVPLLLASMEVLKDMKLKDELLSEYHRSRYRMLRLYLDLHYHVI